MKMRTRSLLFAICAALLLIWPAVALAYTYTFKVPVKVQNVGDDRGSKAPIAKVDVTLYDANGTQVGNGGQTITLYDGDQTATVTINTAAQATSYQVRIDGGPTQADQSKSTLTLPRTPIP